MTEHSFVGRERELTQWWEFLGNALGGEGQGAFGIGDAVPRLSQMRGGAQMAVEGRLAEAETETRGGVLASAEHGAAPMQWRLHAALGRLLRKRGGLSAASAEFAAAQSQLASIVPDEALRRSLVRQARARM